MSKTPYRKWLKDILTSRRRIVQDAYKSSYSEYLKDILDLKDALQKLRVECPASSG